MQVNNFCSRYTAGGAITLPKQDLVKYIVDRDVAAKINEFIGASSRGVSLIPLSIVEPLLRTLCVPPGIEWESWASPASTSMPTRSRRAVVVEEPGATEGQSATLFDSGGPLEWSVRDLDGNVVSEVKNWERGAGLLA